MENQKKPNKFWEFCKKAFKIIVTLGIWLYNEYKKNKAEEEAKAKTEAECHTEEIAECENKKEPK